MSGTTLLAAPPQTEDVALRLLAGMAALNGVVTDYTAGSAIRTLAEALGSCDDFQGIATSQACLLALVYGTAAAYGIEPYGAVSAGGTLTVTTQTGGGGPNVPYNIPIAEGTLFSTAGGVQFASTAAVTMNAGTNSVSVPVLAVQAGPASNSPANSVTNILSVLGYPLYVNNSAALTGGQPVEASGQTLARLAAAQAALGLASPVAVANSCIGVVGSDGSICKFEWADEPWIRLSNTTAGFTVYIDDGTGSASSALLAACAAKITGNQTTGSPGNRPIGVPFTVVAGTAVHSTVAITGVVVSQANIAVVEAAMVAAVTAFYAQLGGDTVVDQSRLAGIASNAATGFLTSITVQLYQVGSGSPVSSITPTYAQRVVLDSVTAVLTS